MARNQSEKGVICLTGDMATNRYLTAWFTWVTNIDGDSFVEDEAYRSFHQHKDALSKRSWAALTALEEDAKHSGVFFADHLKELCRAAQSK